MGAEAAGPAHDSKRLERWVHWSLLSGLVVGGLLMAGGLVAALALDQPRPDGPPPGLARLVGSASRGGGPALMDLGLLALMITPVLRVAVLALGWGLERSWRFLAVSLAVLGLLGVSLALGTG
jgi:hypothetical protein